MSALAVIERAPGVAWARTIEQLREVREQVESCTPEEAKTAEQRIRLAREWLKIADVSAELRCEALRLELVILRRIGELGIARDLLGRRTAVIHMTKALAELDDDEFDSMLQRFVAEHLTPLRVWRWYLESLEPPVDSPNIEDGVDLDDEWEPLKDPGGVVKKIVDELEMGPHSVLDIARAIGHELEMDLLNPVTVRALTHVARDALRADAGDEQYYVPGVGYVTVPGWVSYQQGGHWVRTRFDWAELDQLRQMYSHRERQIEELEEVARNLKRLIEALETQQHRGRCRNALSRGIESGVFEAVAS